MRLHLATLSDSSCKYLDSKYKTPTRILLVEDIVEKKSHNIMMIDIASALKYVEFYEVKSSTIAYDIWIKLKSIYGEDENIRRTKAKSPKEQFD